MTVHVKDPRERLRYDPKTGFLFWLQGPCAGKRAGYADGDRRIVKIAGVKYYEHRLVWLIAYGDWPVAEIDHINRNPHDNRLDNLRLATRAENQRNRSSLSGTSRFKGVFFNPRHKGQRPWRAAIRMNNRKKSLGTFASQEAAARAYDAAAVSWFGEFAYLNFPDLQQCAA